MSTLAFLTTDAQSTDVLARSPMERLARNAGARLQARDGWSVAVGFGS